MQPFEGYNEGGYCLEFTVLELLNFLEILGLEALALTLVLVSKHLPHLRCYCNVHD
jgi:hypothetical protein